MDKTTKQILGAAIGAWVLACVFSGYRWAFFGFTLLIPPAIGALWYREGKTVPLWEGQIPVFSTRSLSYLVAIVATLYFPYVAMVELTPVDSLRNDLRVALFFVTNLGVWGTLIFFSGGKQPAWRDGRFIPLLFSGLAFVVALLLNAR